MANEYAKYLFLYMNGKLSARDVHFLEHNDNFMRLVMLTGKNCKYYDKCSKDIKKDGDFLKQLIELYKDNHEFIASLVEEFCENNKRDFRSIVELNILLSNIYEETEDEVLYPAYLNAEGYYQSMMQDINDEILNIKNQKEREDTGYGFIMVDMSFSGSDIVKRFTAKRMLEDIFLNHPSMEFDELMHYQYSDKRIIEKIGVRVYLNDILKGYDKALCDYVGVYPELMDGYVSLANDVLKNWDNYLTEINTMKIDQCYEEMNRFIEESGYDSSLLDLFYGIVLQSKNKEKIIKYLDVDVKDIEKIDMNSLNFTERRFVDHMKNYMDEVFTHDTEWADMEFLEEEKQEGNIEEESTKVLKFDFVNKRRID